LVEGGDGDGMERDMLVQKVWTHRREAWKDPKVTLEGKDAQEFFRAGIVLLQRGEEREALKAFRRAARLKPEEARYLSYYGMCLARAGRDAKEGLRLCEAAVAMEFYLPETHLNHARVLRLAGRLDQAQEALREGLVLDQGNREILRELDELGIRQRPLFPFLDRKNPLNRWAGRARRKFHPKRKHPHR
jgi:tetratricopeptide (TPR) repeat protein